MENFVIDSYGKKTTFASFLPGIAGIKGIPIWCYYVNRGQGVVSFGVDNKDHAIMEFYPAHTAYQNVKRTGFRTFIKSGGKFAESFADEDNAHKMLVGANTLSIEEDNNDTGLRTKVTYFVLPEEKIGGLVRKVCIENISDQDKEIEIIDGMPALIPYGVSLDSMKNMAQLSKAWMQVEEPFENVSYYRVRASMEDTASVTTVAGGNFSLAIDEKGEFLKPVIDPDAVFGYDNSLSKPVNFIEGGLGGVLDTKQSRSNLIPSSFFAKKDRLSKGESTCIYELIGQVEDVSVLKRFLSGEDGSGKKSVTEKSVSGKSTSEKSAPSANTFTKLTPKFFEKKLERAIELTDDLTDIVSTKTGDKNFDEYTRYTFMDNVLRGGLPIKIGDNKVFYVYSRKHGDLEREYNYFAMSPEFYSQGNGNFRDVNQNRRMDSFFAPYTDRAGIKMFYSLIQTDGYNPLSIEKITYSIDRVVLEDILSGYISKIEEGHVDLLSAHLEDYYDGDNFDKEKFRNTIYEVVKDKHFTPGHLALVCDGDVFDKIMDSSTADVNASFGEGYWSDHWTYNLDLVEEYLSLYPEKRQELLFEKDYTYFASHKKINKRSKRYEETEGGIRQYYALDTDTVRQDTGKELRTKDGHIYKGTLLEKLILLCTTKFAALDPEQMGVEMEGGKPGWYDALNGLPGLLGSSMAESYELERTLAWTIDALSSYEGDAAIFKELWEFMSDIYHITENVEDCNIYWNLVNDRKEKYWDDVFERIDGSVSTVSATEVLAVLTRFKEIVDEGIKKAIKLGNGICPTYFYYDVTYYTKDDDGIHPVSFKVNMVPLFLEGPVRYLKTAIDLDKKRALYDRIKESDLYDDKLKMYKINAPLSSASYELGRCRCFTPGWLENESIWLHMEYRYLLELVRSGLYKEYIDDLRTALVPFMDPSVYGRSIYENSSFIASSAGPDDKIHGKGFVARLSGSTIEFMSMWKIMMFGNEPFMLESGELVFAPSPVIPKYLIPESDDEGRTVSARFMGQTDIVYHLGERKDYIPGEYKITKMVVTDAEDKEKEITGQAMKADAAIALRSGAYKKVDIYLD